jgi:hypothetical protein
MAMQFDKECQHNDGEHVEFGRSVPETSEEGLRLFNSGHIGIVVTVPPYERDKYFSSEHTRTWLSAITRETASHLKVHSSWDKSTVPSQEENRHQNSEHTRPWMSANVPYQDGDQCPSSGHTGQRIDMAIQLRKGYHH